MLCVYLLITFNRIGMTTSNHKNNSTSSRTSDKKFQAKSESSRTNQKTTIEINKAAQNKKSF